MNDPPRFSGQFVRPADEAGRAWSVFLPRFTNGVEVTVNGVAILDSRRDPAANRPDRNTPAIAVIPPSLLRDGDNAISIRLFIWGPVTGFLDRIWVGPDELLRPSYDLRTLIFVTLPVVFSSWQAILAVILGIMWVMRRHEPAYGVLAAAMAVGVAQAFLQTPMGHETPFSRLNVVLISSAPHRMRAGADVRAVVLGHEMAALWLGAVSSRRAAGAGRPVRKPGAGSRTVSRSRRSDGRRLARPHGRHHRPFGAAAAQRRQLSARLRGHDHADLLDHRHARSVPGDAEPHLRLAAVLFGDAGGDRRRADLAVRPRAERGRQLCRPPRRAGARGRGKAESQFRPRGGARPRRGAGARAHAADARPA